MIEIEDKSCNKCLYDDNDVFDYPCCACKNNYHPSDKRYKDAPLFWRSREESNTPVDHPTHYNQGGIECIDAMVSAFGKEAVENFCLVNAFKYVWRTRDKNGLEDVDKAIWYLTKYKELVNNG